MDILKPYLKYAGGAFLLPLLTLLGLVSPVNPESRKQYFGTGFSIRLGIVVLSYPTHI